MAYEDYDQYARRIERWDGVVIRERINSGRDGHIIDFEMDWPAVPLAQPERHRAGAVEASAIIFDTPGRVSEWELRLPQIPVTGRVAEAVGDDITRVLQREFTDEIRVLLADGETSYTPHVFPVSWSPGERDPGAVLDDIHDAWEAYRTWAYGEYDPQREAGRRA